MLGDGHDHVLIKPVLCLPRFLVVDFVPVDIVQSTEQTFGAWLFASRQCSDKLSAVAFDAPDELVYLYTAGCLGISMIMY